MTRPTGRRLTEARVGEFQRELGHLEGRIDQLERELRERDTTADRLVRELSIALVRVSKPPTPQGGTTR